MICDLEGPLVTSSVPRGGAMAATATRSHVGAHVDSAAVREVSGRLLEEGRSRLDSAPESALVALRQAFSLEQQFGVDGERLCCVCASICHALSRLAHPHAPLAAVEPLVAGLEVTGFSDVEEGQVGQTGNVPFLIESKFKELGASYVCGEPWTSKTAAAGKLLTGQNPQSSEALAALVVKTLA